MWACAHYVIINPFLTAESVAVGVVLKNPLKGVPLLMTDVCLVWSATPTSTSHAPSSAAVCEVVKRVLLQPEEEKMVGCSDMHNVYGLGFISHYFMDFSMVLHMHALSCFLKL